MHVKREVKVMVESKILGHSKGDGEARVLIEVVLLLEVQIRPDEPSNILSLSAVEANQAPQSVCAKDDAAKNMTFILVTLDTSHLEMSLLNDDAE